ncbi:MAG: penicillin-binding protein 2 [Oscillospiraceae bacterium]|jgi:penicillin-binding protein 2|nr:penicillin-binding protein 2 [Oscillospiraceae bacterium]
MGKRTIAFFSFLMLGMFFSVLMVFRISNGTELAQTAEQQSNYKLTVAATRGTIYDCHLSALTGADYQYVAAVVPGIETTAVLNRVLSASRMDSLYETLSAGRPFTLRIPSKIEQEGIDVFTVQDRYPDSGTAVHLLGYLDGSGKGASGIEKAYDSLLSSQQGRITVTYKVDALNRVLAGEEKQVSDTTARKNSGVVLTLDKYVQTVAEQAADEYLTKGAIVVLEVPTGKIRAMVSRPSYNQNDVASVLKAKDSPLLNRAVSAYSVGSVFKLVAAATALEYGISPDYTYDCTGGINVDGGVFHCYNAESHGTENMKQAIANSCNTYFVNLMQQVPQENFLKMAGTLGFGRAFQLAPGISSGEGVLPSLKSLSVPRALANFSFGQGKLTATPLQVAAMTNAIASGGLFTSPSLYEGTVDEKLQYTDQTQQVQGERAVSENTARLLREFMKASIEEGTSHAGKPDHGGAGAKTATAQTGQYVDGTEQVESWFTGFFPYDHPQYAVTVFEEGGDGGGRTCGPVFKEIAEELYRALG